MTAEDLTPNRRRRRRHRLRDQSGFSLIEVVFTALIVILISAATAKALVATSSAAGDEQFRSEANALAAQDQDQMRALSDQQLNAIQVGTQPGQAGKAPVRQHTTTLGGITFTVVSGASPGVASGNSGCTASAASSFETVSVVTWSEGNVSHHVEVDSLLARPVIGDLVVSAKDSSGAMLPGVNVTVSPGPNTTGLSNQSAQTNTLGCALFAGLVPGTYTLSAAKSGYVDINGNNQATSTVPVPSTGTQASVVLGVASGPINATFRSPTSTAGEANGFSWLQTGMAAPGVSATATSTSGASGNNLIPGKYAVWGGRCAAQEPVLGQNSPGPTSVTVVSGQSVATTVIEPALQVTVVVPSGNSTYYVKPGDIVDTFRSGTGCIDSWAASVSSQAGTPSTSLTASGTPTTGWLANPGQPWAAQGTLTVCADFYDSSSYGGNNTWYQGSTVTSNSNSSTATAVTVTINGNTSGQCALQTS